MKKILEVKNLTISLSNQIIAVRSASFDLYENEILGIVGESGCGKSICVQSLLRLIPKSQARIEEGAALYQGKDLFSLSTKELRKIRGKEIGIIFQDPFSSLNPTMKIGSQVLESVLEHTELSKQEAKSEVYRLLHLVGIPEPHVRYHQYPHELSGGLLQRAMIALAIAPGPRILIADEPTTALDVTIQAQILDLLRKLRNVSIIFITHDLGIVSELCDRLMVMYAGKFVEWGNAYDLIDHPMHPYTQMLLKAHPAYATSDKLETIPGKPSLITGQQDRCAFVNRCPYAMNICLEEDPPYYSHHQRDTACFLYDPRTHHARDSKSKEILSPEKEMAKSSR